MNVLYFLLLLAAAVCFALAAFWRPVEGRRLRVDLVALGLLLWVAVSLIRTARGL